jgi:small subunit ribosomal protein S9
MAVAKTTKKVTKKAVAPKPKAVKKEAPKKEVIKKGTPLAHGVGRRKASVARVWLRRGSGKMIVNGREYSTYFDTDVARSEAIKPISLIPAANNYDIEVNVIGGGLHGQAGATKVAVARAFVALSETHKPMLRGHGLLTVDARVKERKKYGQKAARRKFQFVKR